MGFRIAPFVFTEYGVLILSNVLKSENAIRISIQIIRVFTRMREMILNDKDLLLKIERFEKRMDNQDKSIKQLFYYIRQLIEEKEKPRKPVGFRRVALSNFLIKNSIIKNVKDAMIHSMSKKL